MPRERSPDRRIAGLIGLIVAVLVGLGSLVLVEAAARESLPTLTQATRSGAETVGETVAGQIGRALSYGIPLEDLYGLDGYFGGIVAGSPHVEALGLYDPSGAIIDQTRPGIQGPVFPVMVDGETRARLVLTPAPPLVGPAIDRLWIALAANATLAGLIAGLVSYLFLSRHNSVALRRLGGLMASAMADEFPAPPPARGSGAVAAAFRAYDHGLDELRGAARRLADAVATVRAIDFDGSLAARLEPLVRPAAGALTLSDVERSAAPAWTERPMGRLWLATVAAGVYAMTLPFIANFAIDRSWNLASPVWWPVVPGLAEALAAVPAFLLFRHIRTLFRPVVAAAGLAAAGLATAPAFWVGDYMPFLELRLAAGAGLGAALAALAGGTGTGPTGRES
ncbi:MAG: hypothetical protein GVY13_02655, partial [Alphaproteobacteria bacterium]|nr:hypothetical protein [Alphaproteobacteria bacterium]